MKKKKTTEETLHGNNIQTKGAFSAFEDCIPQNWCRSLIILFEYAIQKVDPTAMCSGCHDVFAYKEKKPLSIRDLLDQPSRIKRQMIVTPHFQKIIIMIQSVETLKN